MLIWRFGLAKGSSNLDGLSITAVSTAVTAAVTGIGGIIIGLRKGRADAAKTHAEANVLSSADNREWAGLFLARLTATEARLSTTEGKLDASGEELDECRKAREAAEARAADFERRLAHAERDILEMREFIRKLGHTPPGETPPKGTPPARPTKEA